MAPNENRSDLASTRYFSVTRITVRPGHAAEYEENRKLVKAAHESAKLADRYSIWQAASGAPTGTYFMFVARKSLAELDDATLHAGADYLAALGGAGLLLGAVALLLPLAQVL